ncbi:YkvA family protein [Pontibacter silvestris]|uniref:YkvA family protein n=1 Tax=Pontibacter silvestris TaxID=2305183 RepID=A0ABW4WT99_9BACT|nr:YkvA family protein [Pontibacter silvestris]MCC9138750.1 DUF1232 domain-containing protein [Pontibacter silvestris]
MENQKFEGKNVAQSTIFKTALKKAEKYLKHPTEVAKLLNDVFQKATAKKSVGALASEVWENMQLLGQMIKASTSGEYKGIPNTTVVGGIAVFIYFLTPIDLIPDFIPVIGLLDDATLLAWFMTSIKSELDKFKEWQESKATPTAQQEQTEQQTTVAPIHNADISYGTPKYSDQPGGTLNIETDPKS